MGFHPQRRTAARRSAGAGGRPACVKHHAVLDLERVHEVKRPPLEVIHHDVDIGELLWGVHRVEVRDDAPQPRRVRGEIAPRGNLRRDLLPQPVVDLRSVRRRRVELACSQPRVLMHLSG